MAKKEARRLVLYWICCDCKVCLDEIGQDSVLKMLSSAFDTDQAARQYLKAHPNQVDWEGHTSLFIAREITEAIDPLPKQKPKKRKAA